MTSKYNRYTDDSTWDVRPGKDDAFEIWSGQLHVATVHHAPGMFRLEAKANAELIARAPAMYEALKRQRLEAESHSPAEPRRNG